MKLITKYFLIGILFLSACTKNIDYDIPEGEMKIVVNALVNPESLVHINLSKSLHILSNALCESFFSSFAARRVAEFAAIFSFLSLPKLIMQCLVFHLAGVLPNAHRRTGYKAVKVCQILAFAQDSISACCTEYETWQ